MNRYFFDIVNQRHSHYDYQGRALDAPEQALRLAELLALDLEVKSEGDWSGWFVSVRDPEGKQYYSIPVQCADLIAA